MGNRMSQTICCSARDKNERTRGLPRDYSSRFWCTEVELQISEPRLTAFAPLWCGETTAKRRIALASSTEVQIYVVAEDYSEAPEMTLEHWLTLKPNQGVLTGIVFTEETLSRHLAVAFSPPGVGSTGHTVRIFGTEETDSRRVGKPWDTSDSQACVASLEDHRAPISRMVTNPTYLITSDTSGVAFVWQKSRAFLRRSTAKLHKGGVADLAADRLFAYSAGMDDKCVCVWSVPDLELRHTFKIEIPQVLKAGGLPDANLDDLFPTADALPKPVLPTAPASAPYRLQRITALRRPLSRWAGSQGSARRANTPKGTLYIAGVLTSDAEGASPEMEGAGVLMEWSLGLEPACQCAQIAHDTPIASLVYGPYDNGPLITADARGTVRVWDCVPRLGCSQQVRVVGNGLDVCPMAMVVEPQHGIYITVGDKRLFVWRRSHPAGEQLDPI